MSMMIRRTMKYMSMTIRGTMKYMSMTIRRTMKYYVMQSRAIEYDDCVMVMMLIHKIALHHNFRMSPKRSMAQS